MKLPVRYLPERLSKKDKSLQAQMISKSRKLYRKGKYFSRKQLPSFQSKKSKHIVKAMRVYNISDVNPDAELSKKTGCSLKTLKGIVKKGEGAYYSSGSRPNQTAQSWGLARLASSLTAGKAAAVDFNMIESGCDHSKKAYKLAKEARRKYKYGHSKTRKVVI